MSSDKVVIPILTSEKKIQLTLFGENSGETIVTKEDASENGEAPIQIKEGCFYEYKIDEGYSLLTSEIVSQSKINKSSGRISPNIFVGTLSIDVLKTSTLEKCGELKLEVQSVKTSYREDYRHMLEEITEKCTDLLLQHTSPVSQFLEVNFNGDANTLYQRFAFIKSILDSVEFKDAVHKIISSPAKNWTESETYKDIRNVKRFHNSEIRQLARATNRINLPEGHSLKKSIDSVTSKVKVNYKTETVDTPENRFVKHVLFSIQTFCSDFKIKVKGNERIKLEAGLLEDRLRQDLSHSIFKEISAPAILPLNSPVLQRREGYREILRVWLMFDLAAKMIWKGGDDVYSGNKRDVATLYEYWLFFKLLEVVQDVFRIDPLSVENLMEETDDELGLKLKQGKYLPLHGVYVTNTRKLNVEFAYNKTFRGDNTYPSSGSWTRSLRPDYTLSIWPYIENQAREESLKIAEEEELIVHIHFDAKYKIENLQNIFGNNDNLEVEKEDQKKGTYKRADLLKMHTYRDAIRRTAGAYVLYPGTEKGYLRSGFHEIIPGLGAFSIRPSKTNSGTEELKAFLVDVVHHFMNRASQREKMALRTFETHKDPKCNQVNELLPETYGANRSLLPDETFVLIGFYNGVEHLKWIQTRGLYNTRAGNVRGSLKLGPGEASAKFVLLHTTGESISGRIFQISETGPRILSRKTLERLGYHKDESKKDNYYLTYRVKPITSPEFFKMKWDLRKLKGYKTTRDSAIPFSVSLTELMHAVVRE